MQREKNPCRNTIICRDSSSTPERTIPVRKRLSHDDRPRNVAFSYMPPAYYARGFRILDAYKREFDFTEMRKLLFLEDPEKKKEWGALRNRLPYPENRVVDLPGTRDLHFKNYYMRSLTPESAMSWRNSITKPSYEDLDKCSKEKAAPPLGVAESIEHMPLNVWHASRGIRISNTGIAMTPKGRITCNNDNCPFKPHKKN